MCIINHNLLTIPNAQQHHQMRGMYVGTFQTSPVNSFCTYMCCAGDVLAVLHELTIQSARSITHGAIILVLYRTCARVILLSLIPWPPLALSTHYIIEITLI